MTTPASPNADAFAACRPQPDADRLRLAIADPPYPPNLLGAGHGTQLRASRWYGTPELRRAGLGRGCRPADEHPHADAWDDPAPHRALLEELVAGYDGWALACPPDAVAAGVDAPLPRGTRLLVWHKRNAMPTGARVLSRWEAVLAYVPGGRRGRGTAPHVPDVLSASTSPIGFAGAKPACWTDWVLDVLGYRDGDLVVDLFPGSRAVSKQVAQTRVDLPAAAGSDRIQHTSVGARSTRGAS